MLCFLSFVWIFGQLEEIKTRYIILFYFHLRYKLSGLKREKMSGVLSVFRNGMLQNLWHKRHSNGRFALCILFESLGFCMCVLVSMTISIYTTARLNWRKLLFLMLTGSTGAHIFMGFGSKNFDWTIKIYWNASSNKGYFQRRRVTGKTA